MRAVGWRAATEAALYGPEGFFVRGDDGPAAHFRTSVHASPLFAAALLRLLVRVDEALGHPERLDVVDVGAGRGELLTSLRALLGPRAAKRVRFVAVEPGPRPPGLDRAVEWRRDVPEGIVGMLVATEWLDNVPLDIAEVDEEGRLRRVLVDPANGVESLGALVDAADLLWLSRWWPLGPANAPTDTRSPDVPQPDAHAPDARPTEDGPTDAGSTDAGPTDAGPTDAGPTDARSTDVTGRDDPGRTAVPAGARAEIGWPRDVAWADAVAAVRRGCALSVDYGHVRATRPVYGTLTGYRRGRQIQPVPDGSCDVTAHVAMDAVACAAGKPYTLVTQRRALKALGVHGGRPPLDLARTDPARYLRELSGAGAAAELTDPAGLGGHWWLLHGVGIRADALLGRTDTVRHG